MAETFSLTTAPQKIHLANLIRINRAIAAGLANKRVAKVDGSEQFSSRFAYLGGRKARRISRLARGRTFSNFFGFSLLKFFEPLLTRFSAEGRSFDSGQDTPRCPARKSRWLGPPSRSSHLLDGKEEAHGASARFQNTATTTSARDGTLTICCIPPKPLSIRPTSSTTPI
jgi:hypothetical protein